MPCCYTFCLLLCISINFCFPTFLHQLSPPSGVSLCSRITTKVYSYFLFLKKITIDNQRDPAAAPMEEETHQYHGPDPEKLCDICGDVGYWEHLTTCSKCGLSKEHLYCMQVIFKDAIHDWICETCMSSTDLASPAAPGCGSKEYSKNCSDAFHHDTVLRGSSTNTCDDLGRPCHSKRKHVATTGKVKFLTAEEVMRLSSGAAKQESPSKSYFRDGSNFSPVAPKFPSTRRNPNPIIIPPCVIKPSVDDSKQISSRTNQQSPKTSTGVNTDVEERDVLNILDKLRLCRPHFPALYATWKGGFKFDKATRGVFYGGFQALLPCRVHRKVYESSQKIPLVLQVKLLPKCNIWAELFQDSYPDFRDIALYFFHSSNIGRAKKSHASLFRLMETEHAAMRSCIDGTELLIFTSKQLDMDSQDIVARSGMGNFLWGVFRCAKQDKIICKEFPSLVSPLGSAKMDSQETVDMEIDMVGGSVVGRIDVAAPKESSRSRTCGGEFVKDVEKEVSEHGDHRLYSKVS